MNSPRRKLRSVACATCDTGAGDLRRDPHQRPRGGVPRPAACAPAPSSSSVRPARVSPIARGYSGAGTHNEGGIVHRLRSILVLLAVVTLGAATVAFAQGGD